MLLIYCRVLYLLRLSKWDPSSAILKEAYAEAFNAANAQIHGSPPVVERGEANKPSPWPVMLFISFILTAPYLIMKLLGNATNSTHEQGNL